MNGICQFLTGFAYLATLTACLMYSALPEGWKLLGGSMIGVGWAALASWAWNTWNTAMSRRRFIKWHAQHLCPGCGYSLLDLPTRLPRCPECGCDKYFAADWAS